MSTLHTLNGVRLLAIQTIQADSEKIGALRAALVEAIAIIDEERSGTKSSWSREDSAKLERLRALVKS